MPKSRANETPEDVRLIRKDLQQALCIEYAPGQRIGDAQHGVYAFYDYDREPIYVGQTAEKLRTRIRRHLTNQRTDAVAMSVLDPFEVYEVEMWPFWSLHNAEKGFIKQTLNSAEYTVFQNVLEHSVFGAILNEVPVAKADIIEFPSSVRKSIVPKSVYERRKHADIRIARRASTIARLAQIISERSVQPGLRQTLLTQARRLEHLARGRVGELSAQSTNAADTE